MPPPPGSTPTLPKRYIFRLPWLSSMTSKNSLQRLIGLKTKHTPYSATPTQESAPPPARPPPPPGNSHAVKHPRARIVTSEGSICDVTTRDPVCGVIPPVVNLPEANPTLFPIRKAVYVTSQHVTQSAASYLPWRISPRLTPPSSPSARQYM